MKHRSNFQCEKKANQTHSTFVCERLLKVEIGIINRYRIFGAYKPIRVPKLSSVVSFHRFIRFGAESGMVAIFIDIVIDSIYDTHIDTDTDTDGGFRHHLLCAVFMPVHSLVHS